MKRREEGSREGVAGAAAAQDEPRNDIGQERRQAGSEATVQAWEEQREREQAQLAQVKARERIRL